MAAWPPSATGFFDISSVFQVNGLAPQQFKHQTYRTTQSRPRNKQRPPMQQQQLGSGNNDQGPSHSNQRVTSSGQSHQYHNSQHHANYGAAKTSSKMENAPRASLEPTHEFQAAGVPFVNANISPIGDPMTSPGMLVPVGTIQPIIHPDNGQVDMYRFPPPNTFTLKEMVAPRHRRKKRDDDPAVTTNGPTTPAHQINGQGTVAPVLGATSNTIAKSQFDLVEEAFPPLPGLEASNGTLPAKPTTHQPASFTPNHTTSEGSTQTVDAAPPVWGENRLADVVKGVVKGRGKPEKDEETPSPRSNSPKTDESGATVELSSVAMTPPTSPHNKPASNAAPPVKCTMSDKSTKTDDVLLNGCERDVAPVPTTTNAATMTTVVQTDASQIKPAPVTPTTVAAHPVYTRQESKGGGPQPVPVPSPPPLVSC